MRLDEIHADRRGFVSVSNVRKETVTVVAYVGD